MTSTLLPKCSDGIGLLSGKCMLLGSASSQHRFGVTDIKALGMSQLSGLGKTVL